MPSSGPGARRSLRPVAARAAVAALLAAAVTAPAAAGASWRADPLWDDGNAEFCAYEVDWRRYGELFPGRALLILVKEPWAPDLDVKADRPRPDGFDVLKLNHVRDVPTGIYTYHQMASVYLRRDTGALRKLAVTSSEACGVSTAEMTGGVLATSSYFDGQGRRSLPWPAGALAEDGLPATLRDHVTGELPASLSVFPTLMAGRFAPLQPAAFALSRRQVSGVELPVGEVSGVELRLERGGDWMSYLFSADPPHELLALGRSDGTEYRLARCERIPYWRMNGPGSEAWLPPTVRSR